MRLKFLKLHSPLLLPIVFNIILFAASKRCMADDFKYFDNEIDYWGAKKESLPEKASTSKSPAKLPQNEVPQKENGFEWHKFLDPKNKEFFREGDYTPPEPFMELVRNPTDYNIKMWFAYMDKKNELSDQLNKKMQEFIAKGSSGITAEGKEMLQPKLRALPQADPDFRRYRFRFYFDSHCPHCHKMFETMSQLQNRGFFVEGRQVDTDTRGLGAIPFPVQQASKQELAQKDIQSVPVLLIGDLKKKVLYRMSGYQSLQSVFNLLSQESAK